MSNVGIDFSARYQSAVTGVGAIRTSFQELRAEIATGNEQIRSMADLIEKLKASATGLPAAVHGMAGGIGGGIGPGPTMGGGGVAPPITPPGVPPAGGPAGPSPPVGPGRSLLDGLFPRTHGGVIGGVVGGLLHGNIGGVAGGAMGTVLGNLLLPGVGGIIGGMLGGAAGSGAQNGMMAGVPTNQAFLESLDGFSRRLNDTSEGFDDLERSVKNAGAGLRMTYAEQLAVTNAFASAMGISGPGSAARAIEGGQRVAAGYADSFGLDKEHTASSMGRMQLFSRDQASTRDFALMLGDVITRSGSTALAGQITDSFSSAVQRIVTSTGGDVPNLGAMAALVTGIGSTGNPTLRGASGIGVLERMNSTFMRGGGAGDPSFMFNMNALDRANPNLGSNPYALKHLMEQGLFGSESSAHLGGGTRTNLEAVLDRFGIKPGSPASALPKVGTYQMDAIARNLGIEGHTQTLDILKGFTQYGSGGLSNSMDLLDRAGIDRSKFPMGATSELSMIANGRRDDALAKLKDDKNYAGLNLAGMSDEELARTLASRGRGENRGTELIDTRVNLENAQADLSANFVALRQSIDSLKTEMARLADGGIRGVTGNDYGSAESGPGRLPPARVGQPQSVRFLAR